MKNMTRFIQAKGPIQDEQGKANTQNRNKKHFNKGGWGLPAVFLAQKSCINMDEDCTKK